MALIHIGKTGCDQPRLAQSQPLGKAARAYRAAVYQLISLFGAAKSGFVDRSYGTSVRDMMLGGEPGPHHPSRARAFFAASLGLQVHISDVRAAIAALTQNAQESIIKGKHRNVSPT